jgi:hypothetical protein
MSDAAGQLERVAFGQLLSLHDDGYRRAADHSWSSQ